MIHHAIKQLIQLALEEDIGPGDITTENLINVDMQGKGFIRAKESLVIAGLDIAKYVFESLDPVIQVIPKYSDGETVKSGTIIQEVHGSLRALLIGERTALNFLQRLSGIATHVRAYVNELENKAVRLVDTRKTTPGWRILEKYAVRIGGARNHRMGLYDGVLIKNNHIAVSGGIRKAVEQIRRKVHHLVKIEVEVSNAEEVKQALDVGADVIMLDNMNIDQIKQAAALIDGKAIIEVSGGVTKEHLSRLADTGVHLISAGALTHSARSVDISMRIENNDLKRILNG